MTVACALCEHTGYDLTGHVSEVHDLTPAKYEVIHGGLSSPEVLAELEAVAPRRVAAPAPTDLTTKMLGVTFAITGDTEFKDDTEQGKTLGDVSAGDFVDLRGTFNERNGSFVANRIRVREASVIFVEVEAPISAIDAENGTVTVGGVDFHM